MNEAEYVMKNYGDRGGCYPYYYYYYYYYYYNIGGVFSQPA